VSEPITQLESVTQLEPIVQFKDVSKRFGDYSAVENINLDIHRGEFVFGTTQRGYDIVVGSVDE